MHEALASNVPVIASDIGVMKEKINDGFNGYKFETGNWNQLKNIMENIIDNIEIMNEIKEKMSEQIIPTIEQEAYAYSKEYSTYDKKTDKVFLNS